MTTSEEKASPWLPPLVGRIPQKIISSQAEHARDVKKQYLEAEQRGFAEGLEKAKNQVQKENMVEKKALLKLAEKLAQPLADLNDEVVSELKTLISESVKILTHDAYARTPELIVKVLEEGVAALPAQTKEIIIRLHPKDVKRVNEVLNLEADQSLKKLFIVEDHKLQEGDVIFKTKDSELDATLSERLNKVISLFWQMREENE